MWVWCVMCGIYSNTEFVDSDFRLVSSQTASAPESGRDTAPSGVIGNEGSSNLIDPDTLLAIQLSQSYDTDLSVLTTGHVAPPAHNPTATHFPSAPMPMREQSQEEVDRHTAMCLQEQLDREVAVAAPSPTAAQEDADRQAALRLQEEWNREAAEGSRRPENDMSDEQLAAYQQAELDFYDRRIPQESRKRSQSKSQSSSCSVS